MDSIVLEPPRKAKKSKNIKPIKQEPEPFLPPPSPPKQDEEPKLDDPLEFMKCPDPQEKRDTVNDFFTSLDEPGATPQQNDDNFDFMSRISAVFPGVEDDEDDSDSSTSSLKSFNDKESSESVDIDAVAKNLVLPPPTAVEQKVQQIDAKIEEYEHKLRILKQQRVQCYGQLRSSKAAQKNFIKPIEEAESPKSVKSMPRVRISKGIKRRGKLRKRGKSLLVGKNKKKKKKEYEIIDAIAWMKKGSSMLKYGRFGYPHFRHFELSKDGEALVWYSSSKKITKSRIELNSVSVLQKGQKTSIFKKHPQPKLVSCSFSLIYGPDGIKTLDVITKNKNAFILWTSGLEKLIEYHRAVRDRIYDHNHGSGPKESLACPAALMVKIPKRNVEAMENRLAMQPSPPRKVVQKDLEETIKTFSKLMSMCNDPKYNQMNGMEVVMKRLVELETEIEKVRHAFETKSLNVASHEIWRCSVEIKALDSRVHALIKSNKGGLVF